MKIFYRTDILFTIAVQLLAIPKTLVATKNSAPVNPKFHHPDPDPNIPWDSFSFSLNGVRTDYMWLNNVNVVSDSDNDIKDNLYSTNTKDCLVPLGPLPLHPTCTVLNYGQGLFEGLKAFRRADGSIALFRPEQNALRMLNGADRILLPPVSVQTFLHAADAVVRANAKWVPPHQKGALYLRPLLFGSGEDLGVKPSSQSTFCIYSSPVGNYFKGGLKAIRLQAVLTESLYKILLDLQMGTDSRLNEKYDDWIHIVEPQKI